MSDQTPTPRYGTTARRLWRWWIDPFQTKIDVHERTRIEWRLFPPRLRVQALPMSLQEAIDAAHEAGGGVVSIRPGRIHLTEAADLTGRQGIRLRDMTLIAHGQYAIKAGLPDDAR